jgi:glycosyltransferase involved in cell wall biosynthesis
MPYSLYEGVSLRVKNLFKLLGSRHQIDLICFVENEIENKKFLKDGANIFRKIQTICHIPFWKNKDEGRFKKLINVFYFDIDLKKESSKLRSQLPITINNNKYDVIFCIGMNFIPYLDIDKNIPVVVDMVDSSALPLYRDFQISNNFFEKLRYLKRFFIQSQREKKYLTKCEKVIVVSYKDAEAIRKSCSNIKVEIIPNGVDAGYFNPRQTIQNGPSLLFTGVMNFPPNVQAMLYFVQSIFPQLQNHYPNIILNIVGKSPTPDIVKLNTMNKHINVTGFVEDIRPYFEKSTIYICPMISGAGIKNKLLEAFAMGKAVVATALACEGIEAIHRKHLLIAQNADDFIKYVSELLSNMHMRQELGENARRFVEDKYSWSAQANKLDNLLKEIIAKDN